MTTETKYTFEESSDDPVTLYYFDIPGKAEGIRYALYYAKIPFVDVRMTRDDFTKKRNSGELPYGQVPALRATNGTLLAQSASIMRMVGKMSKTMYPEDIIEAAKVDAILDFEVDLFMGVSVSKYSSRFGFGFLDDMPEVRQSVRKVLNDEILPKHLSNLERTIDENVGPWLAGQALPSIADFTAVPRLISLVSGNIDGISLDLLKGYPKLLKLVDSFYALDAVKEFQVKSSANTN
mmetsp:Transcript_6883/g.10145  ORF Transcript_6883/g.10145 Transcript_6883/m.10145 type:complete len:236 (+) Transcript_6883:163-870(+)|eukprot:CAMPEP_0196812694 /NCGR_PEP_ID=MMETSP1362-20130617/29537_1 /TAXON_ID=163516 /ORGANISM="Leptocylindrus danicus, Strain CCMP1856" /LENGTH=235 /DNA_ID=CAMNT_0042188505 /DNA_START=129 /DNA_END=836 /DNA_ORIENTATION=+